MIFGYYFSELKIDFSNMKAIIAEFYSIFLKNYFPHLFFRFMMFFKA